MYLSEKVSLNWKRSLLTMVMPIVNGSILLFFSYTERSWRMKVPGGSFVDDAGGASGDSSRNVRRRTSTKGASKGAETYRSRLEAVRMQQQQQQQN